MINSKMCTEGTNCSLSALLAEIISIFQQNYIVLFLCHANHTPIDYK